MGFPDSYRICKSPNQAYKQFGNSVVIDVLQLIGQEIGLAMNKADDQTNNTHKIAI